MTKDLLLSIESSSNICSIAIAEKDSILLEYSIALPNSHDQYLAEFVRRGLQDLGFAPDNFSAVAISSGPGSFTGLRIGTAFAKGFCFGNETKLVPVPTLFAFAYNCKEVACLFSKRIVAVIHSHKDFFFFQFFDYEASPISEVSYLQVEELAKILRPDDFLVGIGAEKLGVGRTFSIFNKLNASTISKAGWKLLLEEKTVSAEEFVPSYYLEFQPKVK